jgi:RimJ/RimL family protein N-acetyltransferase
VREGSGQLVLREIEDRDLGVLFEHWTNPDAIRMAAFTSPDQNDRAAFERRWARLRSDVSTTNRVVEIDGRVVGHIASFDLEGRREVTYWIGPTSSCSDSMHDPNRPRLGERPLA